MTTWATTDEIHAALNRFESAIDGWRRPAAYGIAQADEEGPRVVRVNLNEHLLPAAVLATVCGHAGGTRSYVLDDAMLHRSVELLAPAEACPDFDHPNLRALRALSRHARPEDEIVAVFVDDLDADAHDPYVSATIAAALSGRSENPDGTTTLWRPTGPEEIALVEKSGWRQWPPRLDEQPIFYPVLNEDYALRIAREWNIPASGSAYVTKFHIDTSYARPLPTRRVGGDEALELWVPAEQLAWFNEHLVGAIEVTHRLTS